LRFPKRVRTLEVFFLSILMLWLGLSGGVFYERSCPTLSEQNVQRTKPTHGPADAARSGAVASGGNIKPSPPHTSEPANEPWDEQDCSFYRPAANWLFEIKLSDILLIFFTAVLAFKTAGLDRATRGLQRAAIRQDSATRKSLAVAAKSAEASVEANKINQESFAAEQRAWIAIDATLAGGLKWDARGAHIDINVRLTNLGKTPATDVFFEADTFLMGGRNPVPAVAIRSYRSELINRRQSDPVGQIAFPGRPINITFGLLVSYVEIQANILLEPDWFLPMIRGCAVYRISGSSDLKSTGIVYGVMARGEDNFTRMLRISGGDLTLEQFGITPFPGGDIAS
jgi:hypothetical protein